MAPAVALRIVDEDATGFRSGPAVRMQGDDEDAEDADEGECLCGPHVLLMLSVALVIILVAAASCTVSQSIGSCSVACKMRFAVLPWQALCRVDGCRADAPVIANPGEAELAKKLIERVGCQTLPDNSPSVSS